MTLSKREKIMVACLIIAIITIIWLFVRQEQTDTANVIFPNELEQSGEAEEVSDEEAEMIAEVVIDIKGAVHSPGVYSMHSNERVIDAVQKAGGLLDSADERQINLAGLLEDAMVIYVPEVGEEGLETLPAFVDSAEKEGKIRINSAGMEELEKLPGIGPVKAQAIITYREENGSFKTPEDLLNVSGIGETSLQKIEESIIFD